MALVFGGVCSILALLTRRWVLAWLALAGSAVSVVFGVLSIWTRQTLPVDSTAAGPGFGLILAWFAVVVLSFHWSRVVWARTSVQLAAEQELREATAHEEGQRLYGPDSRR